MKNTTLFNILHSELINMGRNEFFNDNQITYYEDDFNFIKKVLNYDDDVKYIVNEKIFLNITLDTESNDDKFKRHFINKFLDYNIGFQTLEIFASKVCYVFLNHIDFLNIYYSNIDDFLTGKSITDNKGNNKTISDNRFANSTLPQNELNINVDNTILDYADENHISRDKSVTEKDDVSTSNNFNIDTLIKSQNLLKSVFDEFEKECFLLVY